jgi:hypothetical protein
MNDLHGISARDEGTKGRVRRRFAFSRLKALALIIAVGILAGIQIYNPSKRFIEATVGAAIIFIMWNISTLGALLFFIIAYPYPFGISLGHSNFVFLVIIFNIYLLRVSMKLNRFRGDKIFNLPLALIAASYLLSLSNFDYGTGLGQAAFINTSTMFSAILLFYLVLNFIDNEARLKRVINAIIISITCVMVFTLIELLFPGTTIIPSWLYTEHKLGLVVKGLRMKGPFHDYELLAEFLTLSVPLIFYMIIRSRRLLMRFLYSALLITSLFLMFATITRSAIITLVIGLAYMALICRRDLSLGRLIGFASIFAIMIFVIEAFVARYTVTGSLFDRLVKTTFERGFIPGNRYIGWSQGLQRGMWHPFFGNGPALDWSKGVELPVYPHNGYLFLLDMTGFFGLFAYLLLLYRLTKTTLVDFKSSLITSSFTHGFMKILHIWLVMFMIDQLKIEYLRNNTYFYYVWLLFALIPATRNVILRIERERAVNGPQPSAPPPNPRQRFMRQGTFRS